jgi:hypothetical protein
VKQPALLLLAAVALCQNANHLPKPGVATPGVRIPIARLKPLAVFPVAGAPDWIAVDGATAMVTWSVWLSNLRAQNVWRIDPKRIQATLPD